MQFYIESPLEMAPSDTQFENLKKRVKNLEDALGVTMSGTPGAAPSSKKKLWSPSTGLGALALVVAILAWVQPQYSTHKQNDLNNLVDGRIDAKLKEPKDKLDQIGNDIAEINGTLKAWAPFMTGQFFKRTVSLPDKQFRESLLQLKAAAKVASESKTEVSRKDVADVGKRTIALASQNSDSSALAWDTTTALLQYRSVMNAFNPPVNLDTISKKPITEYVTKYFAYSDLGPLTTTYSSELGVPQEQAAALDRIGRDRNKESAIGPAFLFLKDGNVTLDSMHMKNVILMNVHVIYKGGPLQLENVYFLNCTFQITQGSNGTQLADQILTNPDIHLSAS